MDDIQIFGANQEEPDSNLMAILRKLEAAGVSLNPSKWKFNKESVKFTGHLKVVYVLA